jgi:hypothetical protein
VDDLLKVTQEIGCKPFVEVARSNISKQRPHRDWRPYYDVEAHDLVEALGAWEIERFGYSFHDPTTPKPPSERRKRG